MRVMMKYLFSGILGHVTSRDERVRWDPAVGGEAIEKNDTPTTSLHQDLQKGEEWEGLRGVGLSNNENDGKSPVGDVKERRRKGTVC